MKTLLLLIITLPLFAFSQEMAIAWKVSGTWIISNDVDLQAKNAFDSVALGYSFDTAFVTQDSIVQIGFTDGTYKYTAALFGRNVDDTIYTQAFYSCGVTCKNLNECYGGFCFTGSDCKCYCSGTGGCSSVNLGIFSDATIGEVIRKRVLISKGHFIPGE